MSGSGFVKPGWNGTTYRQQVDAALSLHPQVILLAATRNDRDQDQATRRPRTRDRMLRRAPPSGSRDAHDRRHQRDLGVRTRRPRTIDARGRRSSEEAVRDVDGTWLDIGFPLVGHPELLQPDGIHPNAAGQKVVARTHRREAARRSNLAL